MDADGELTIAIHGFRVLSRRPAPQPFKRALRDIAACGFLDPSCTVVKTEAGAQSGITHAGGRYVHGTNPFAPSVMASMREQGIEPPPPPFIVAPGPVILFHEWGHHVDRVWSGDDHAVCFSHRWLSSFYDLRVRGEPMRTGTEAADAMVTWRGFSFELFASLFEDWMRREKGVSWDECDPSLANRGDGAPPVVTVHLRSESSLEEVRTHTYALFERGLGSRPAATLRGELLGPHTSEIIAALPAALERLRTSASEGLP